MEPHPIFTRALEGISPELRRDIQEKRSQALAAWQEYCQQGKPTSLAIPDHALEIFMTEPLLAAIERPASLAIRTVERSDNVLQFFIVDTTGSSEKIDWDDGDRAVLDYLVTHSERSLFEHYVASGKLNPAEHLLLQLSFVRRPNSHKALEFKQFRDRPELRRRGIGRATFAELVRLKDLGFAAVVGIHEPHNQSFYRTVLQRQPVSELTRPQKDEFDLWDPVFTDGTVQFL